MISGILLNRLFFPCLGGRSERPSDYTFTEVRAAKDDTLDHAENQHR